MPNNLHLQKDDPIAIIGAGPSGLGSAYYLKQAGYTNVTIFESRDRIAGMAYTEYLQDPDGKTRAYDMGAVLYDSAYTILREMLIKFKLDTNTKNAPQTYLTSVFGVIFEKMYDLVNNPLSRLLSPQLSEELDKYFEIIGKNRDWIDSPGFPDLSGEKAELAHPFDNFLKNKGIHLLQNFLSVPVICFGYGFLSDLPALYGLKYIHIKNLLSTFAMSALPPSEENNDYYWIDLDTLLPGVKISELLKKNGFDPEEEKVFWFRRLGDGMMSLIEQICIASGAKVYLNVKLQSIKRDGSEFPVNIAYSQGSGLKKTADFKALILAYPPIETSLSPFMQLNPEEKDLFSVVNRQYYWTSTGIVDPHDALGYNNYVEVMNWLPMQPVENLPFLFFSPWKESPRYVVYTGSKTDIAESIIHKSVQKNLNFVAEQRNHPTANFTISEKFTDWVYFPHVSSENLQGNFKDYYTRLNKMQGELSTFYISGLCNFELVENNLSFAKYLIEQHFTDKKLNNV